MLIVIGDHENPVDFGFTRSKVKVTRVTFVKMLIMFSDHSPIRHRAFIFHMLIGANMTCTDFGFTK